MKKVITILAALTLTLGFPAASSAAAKAGATCTKLNQTTGSGASKLTCKKVNGKLVWTATTTGSSVGTMSNPVPVGGSLTVGNFNYQVKGIEFGLDGEICDTNPFNDGCTLDDNFESIVDPNAKFNWAAVTLSATNKSNKVAKPASLFLTTFSLVLPNGQLLKSEIFALGENDFSQVEVIPGGSGSGRIFFQIPKTIKNLKSLIVIRDESSLFGSKDYYFRLEW